MKDARHILFLDIDGVVNCRGTNSFYDIHHPESYRIDETLWGNLETFFKYFPEVKVVIHSGWIKGKDDPNYVWMIQDDISTDGNIGGVYIKTLLPKVISRLGNRYIGCVPYLKGQPKHDRIKQWLGDNASIGTISAVVIDDDASEWTNLGSLSAEGLAEVFFTSNERGLDGETLSQFIHFCSLLWRFRKNYTNFSNDSEQLDEAIAHCREVAAAQTAAGCRGCADDHLQLAAWLEELKRLREENRSLRSDLGRFL